MNDTKYYSVCCFALMPDYPDSDFCPDCKEHTTAMTADEIEAEEGARGELIK